MGDSNSRRRHRERTVLAVGIALLVATSSLAAGASLTSDGRATALGEVPASHAAVDDQSSAGNQSSQEYDASVFGDVAGQVATEDGSVSVEGTATGTDRVMAVLIDRRGRIATELLSVNDGAFEEDDLALVADDGTALSEGRVVAMVLSPGRDGMVGDGELPGVTRADLADFESAFRDTTRQQIGNRPVSRTQRQVVELFYDQTVEDAGSDDLLLAEEFVYTDGRTTIERVLPGSQVNETGPVAPIRVGDTMVVRGLTNRKPEDNAVFVAVVEGPSAAAFDLAATETWGADGVWQVALDTDGVEPGTYTVEAEDGDSADSFAVRILPRENESDSGRAAARSPVTGRSSTVRPGAEIDRPHRSGARADDATVPGR